MPASEPTQAKSPQGRTRMAPRATFSSASAASRASPSKTAPPRMPARWPPRYSSQARDAPEVRMVDSSNPGTASRSGRTSTSTGSALVRRWTASVLASFNRDLLECQVDVDALAPPHQLHDPEDDEAAHEPADEDGEAVGRVA